MAEIRFEKLNDGWNADPNGPAWNIEVSGERVELRFILNKFMFTVPAEVNVGCLSFARCSRWRVDLTNDEGWYAGKGRYSDTAPEWGEFYEILGDDPQRDDPDDWEIISPDRPSSRHFLFYLRDEALEFISDDWSFARQP